MPESRRQTERLHAGRVSADGAVYFVTFVTAGRQPWLGARDAADNVMADLRAWHAEGDGVILAATIMPDHVHVLFRLGVRLGVGRCVSRWKTVGRKAAAYSGDWQRDFWERRVRGHESVEDYALYILLNPYRTGLLRSDASWPWFWLPDRAGFRFTGMLGSRGEPPPEWMGWPDERFAGLATGE